MESLKLQSERIIQNTDLKIRANALIIYNNNWLNTNCKVMIN